jgi:CRISPR-associated protein Csx10
VLRIKLETAVAAGSGFPKPGIVDHDVVHDRFGLPYLPSKRVKGLLRDALREIRETGCFPEITDKDVTGLLGKTGQPDPSSVRFASQAELTEGVALRDWLDTVERRHPAFLASSEILALYTTIRRQTAIGRDTGAPLKNTLRATRELRRGLEFHLRVEGLNQRQERILALAALAVQQMGGSRTRGPGTVSCCLLDGAKKISQAALSAWEKGPLFETEEIEKPGANNGKAGLKNPAAGERQSILRFRITLESPTLFASLDADPNTVGTLDYVPGTAIHGYLARAALERIEDGIFQRLFTSGAVRFSPAWPVIATEGGGASVGIPVPAFWWSKKSDPDAAVNLAAGKPAEPVRRLSGWTRQSALKDSLEGRLEVAKGLDYHHQRDPDPRMGRPGDAEQGKGALFTYESIARGQVFEGQIDGDRASLETVQSLLTDGTTVRLGRSRGVQYGSECRWTWLGVESIAATGDEEDDETVDTFAVLLRSPLIAMNSYGHPCVQFPRQELSEALGGAEVTPKEEFVRREWHSGWLSHQRLPRQQAPACSPGSVFVFQAKPPVRVSQLREAGTRSYGLRQEQGFGRVSIEGFPHEAKEGNCSLTLQSVRPMAAGQVLLPAGDSPARRLATKVFRARLEEKAIEAGLKTEILHGESLPAHALSRLLAIVQKATSLSDIDRNLGGIAPRVVNTLDRAVIEVTERGEDGEQRKKKRLTDFLKWRCWQKNAESLAGEWKTEVGRNWDTIFGLGTENLPAADTAKLVSSYLAALLKKQMWLNRKKPGAVGEDYG